MAICWRTNEGSIYVQIQKPCIAGGVTADGSVLNFAIVAWKRADSLCLKIRTYFSAPFTAGLQAFAGPTVLLDCGGGSHVRELQFSNFSSSVGDPHLVAGN